MPVFHAAAWHACPDAQSFAHQGKPWQTTVHALPTLHNVHSWFFTRWEHVIVLLEGWCVLHSAGSGVILDSIIHSPLTAILQAQRLDFATCSHNMEHIIPQPTGTSQRSSRRGKAENSMSA